MDELRIGRDRYPLGFWRTDIAADLAQHHQAEVMDFSSSIADKVARSTAVHTIDEIAAEIADLLKSNDAQAS